MSSFASNISLSEVPADQLNNFIRSEVEPDTEYIRRCNEVVDLLCQFMQNQFPADLRTAEIRKSGSLGKGTAVKGKSDADLVVFLAGFRTISELRQNLPRILDRMKYFLDKYDGCGDTKITPFFVNTTVNCHGHIHDVDILPSVKLNISQTMDRNAKTVYEEMASMSPSIREYYSAALAPLQIEFVSRVPTKVKTLIRLLKYWRKTYFQESSGLRVPSYILELIVIGEWERAGRYENFDLPKALFHVLKTLKNYRDLKLSWKRNYPNHYCHDLYYVVDPANPFNNVMEACNCWDVVADKANMFLKTARMFNGLPLNLYGWQ